MSFSFSAAGYVEDAAAQLDAYAARLASYPSGVGDAGSVVEFVKAQIAGSAFPGGVFVDANGHIDQNYGSLNLTIRPLSLPAKPAPEAATPEPETAPEPAPTEQAPEAEADAPVESAPEAPAPTV